MKAVAYCGTRNVYEDMITAAKSLLSHTKIDKIYFIIEDDTFPYELPDIFECISVKDQTFFPPDGPNYKNSWTYMVLIRAALTKILPQDLDMVLSLDIDTIVNEDISELWNWNLDNYYLAAAREPFKTNASYLYINFGVSLLNLKKLREDKKDDDIIKSLNTKWYYANEQDCFNDKCQGHIKLLPADYNASDFTGKVWDKIKINHYAGIPLDIWRKKGNVLYYKNKTFEEILR